MTYRPELRAKYRKTVQKALIRRGVLTSAQLTLLKHFQYSTYVKGMLTKKPHTITRRERATIGAVSQLVEEITPVARQYIDELNATEKIQPTTLSLDGKYVVTRGYLEYQRLWIPCYHADEDNPEPSEEIIQQVVARTTKALSQLEFFHLHLKRVMTLNT